MSCVTTFNVHHRKTEDLISVSLAMLEAAQERAPEDVLDSTLDLVMDVRLRLAIAQGIPDQALIWSERRVARLKTQQQARLRSAMRHMEIVTAAEQALQAERQRAEAEARAARDRLEEAHHKLTRTQLELAHTRFKERERLLQDMHDGFGSQLASARMLAEQGELSAGQMVELLDDCMADLYLMADTLSEPQIPLVDALADFRFRCERRLGGLKVQMLWEIQLDEENRSTSDRLTLQVLRIVQEAVNNALRHAQPSQILIRASLEGGSLLIEVADNGCGMPAHVQSGRGLGNMRSRARDIGAELHWRNRQPGTSVLLRCPNQIRP